MKAILQSIKPQYCANIAARIKRVFVVSLQFIMKEVIIDDKE